MIILLSISDRTTWYCIAGVRYVSIPIINADRRISEKRKY